MSKKLPPAVRKEQIMDAAVKLASQIGYTHVTRSGVALSAGVADSLVSAYWGTMRQMRRAIMRRAIETENLVIVAQGLTARDRYAMKAPNRLKELAAQQLIN